MTRRRFCPYITNIVRTQFCESCLALSCGNKAMNKSCILKKAESWRPQNFKALLSLDIKIRGGTTKSILSDLENLKAIFFLYFIIL